MPCSAKARRRELPRELKDLQRRQEKLKQAMAKLEQLERDRAAAWRIFLAKTTAVALGDRGSRVLPTQGRRPHCFLRVCWRSIPTNGMIVDPQVSRRSNDEASTVLKAVENIEQVLPASPREMAADASGYNTGRRRTLTGLGQREVSR